MPERQIHGFVYEKKCIQDYDLIKKENYTASNDAYKEVNGKTYEWQCKLIKLGSSIDLGDIFRNSKKKNFFLHIGFWKDETSNIVEEYDLFFKDNEWINLFDLNILSELFKWIKTVSNDKSYDLKWKKEIVHYKKKWKGKYIKPRFKRDHQSQKRIQCAINTKDFYNFFLKKFEYKEV